MKFDILNRFSGDVQFTADIDCPEDAPRSIKIGLAVKWAIKNDASLNGASLDGASLDFASWPLHCGSKNAIADDRLVSQLLFHATRLDVSRCSGGVREAVEFLRKMAVCNLFPEYRPDTRKCNEFEAD